VPFHLEERGPALANTLTSCVNVGLLLFALRKKLGKLEMADLRRTTAGLVVLALLAGIIALAGWKFWEEKLGHKTIALRIGEVFGPAIVAAVFYWAGAMALRIPAARELFEFAAAKFKRHRA